MEEKEAERSEGEFVVIVAVPEAKPSIPLPREKVKALIELLDNLRWDRRLFKRYVNQALKLRRLEREYGKSFLTLTREYEKLSREEVKLQYSIQQLLEKRRHIEEDLQLYMEQHRLTLELVRKAASMAEALRERGLDLEDLEKGVKVLERFKELGHDAGKIIEFIAEHGQLFKELEELKGQLEEKRRELEEVIGERERLDRELREVYGVVEGVKGLRDELERLGQRKAELEQEISSLQSEVKSLKAEVERLTGVKAGIEEAEEVLSRRRHEAKTLREEVERLEREVSELLEVRVSAEEAKTRLNELIGQIERLERRIEEKRSYADLLEGELAAAHAILRLFADPRGAGPEDLELLAQHIQRLMKVKRGEALAQKPLEPYFLEKTRKAVIDLIMPYLKKDFVPRWAFERIERELRALNERRIALEEEIASLRKSIEARHRIEVARPLEEAVKTLVAVTSEGAEEELKTVEEGKRAKIICVHCREATLTKLPAEHELEELSSKGWKLKFTCSRCGRSYEIEPDKVLRRIRG